MKVTAPSASASSQARASGSAAAPGFAVALNGAGEAAAPGRAPGAGAVASLEALLAMQSADGPTERRRKAVNRAGRVLDALDAVKSALLGADPSAAALSELAAAVTDQRAQTDDSRLEGVLDEIETRAAVELAKAEMSRLAA